jgi:hypothetical protein
MKRPSFLTSWLTFPARTQAARCRPQPSRAPGVEALEDRLVPADLGMPSLFVPLTGWPTFHHDDFRTGQTSAPPLLAPSIEWLSSIQDLMGAKGSAAVPTGPVPAAAYVPTDFGTYGVHKETGATLVTMDGGVIGDTYKVTENPTVAVDGTVYVSTNTWKVEAVTGSGTTLWSYSHGNVVSTTDPLVPQATAALTPPADVFVGLQDLETPSTGSVVALTATSGAVHWSRSVTGNVLSLSYAPDTALGVYVLYARTSTGEDTSFLYKINALTGEIIWEVSTGPALQDSAGYVTVNPSASVLYYPEYPGKVVALDTDTHAKLWTWNLPGPIRGAMTLDVAAGTLYVAWSQGLSAFGPPPTGTPPVDNPPLWTYIPVGVGTIDDSPALAGTGDAAVLYFGTSLGHLEAISSGGDLMWDMNLPWVSPASPAIDSEGDIVIGRDTFGAVEIMPGTDALSNEGSRVSPGSFPRGGTTGPVTFAAVGLPGGLNVGAGIISAMAAYGAAESSGMAGIYTATVLVSDDTATETEVVNRHVNTVNRPPSGPEGARIADPTGEQARFDEDDARLLL